MTVPPNDPRHDQPDTSEQAALPEGGAGKRARRAWLMWKFCTTMKAHAMPASMQKGKAMPGRRATGGIVPQASAPMRMERAQVQARQSRGVRNTAAGFSTVEPSVSPEASAA